MGKAFEAEGREGATSLGVARCLIRLRLSKIKAGCENRVRGKRDERGEEGFCGRA